MGGWWRRGKLQGDIFVIFIFCFGTGAGEGAGEFRLTQYFCLYCTRSSLEHMTHFVVYINTFPGPI